MNVSLTPELEELVNEKVRSGLYQTASEVVREALRLLKQRDDEARRADQRAGLSVKPGGLEAVNRSSSIESTLARGGLMARVHRQAAVIPYRIRKERVEVALVTTSRGKGWIVPKGSVDDGERPRDAAIREAEEEAGLLGVVARKPLGRYRPRQRHGPLPGGCLPDARHRGARALARGRASAAPLDARSRCRGLSARRAAAVRRRGSKAWSDWTPERGHT